MELRSIATRYAALVVALLSVALIVSGALQTWSAHRDRQAALEALQREKAQAAAVGSVALHRRYSAQPGLGDIVGRAFRLRRHSSSADSSF